MGALIGCCIFGIFIILIGVFFLKQQKKKMAIFQFLSGGLFLISGLVAILISANQTNSQHYTYSKFLIALGVVIVFIIVSVILKKRSRKNQLEKAETENTIYVSTTDNAGNDKLERYDLSGFPGNVPCFLSKALETEAQKDFLAARVNYMQAVEELKRRAEPSEYEQLIVPVQKMYDEFVLRDPVYKYLMSKLLQIIDDQNGILQSEISKEFESVDWGTLASGNREVTKDDIYYALYFADRFGHIRRIKKGRSYQLYLPDTEPAQN